MFTKRAKNIVMSLLLTVMVSSVVYAQGIDMSRMNRDIRVSKEVLKAIFSERYVSDMFQNNSVTGMYLPDHGVVFMVQVNTRSHRDESAEEMKKAFSETQDELYDFFGSYADVIKQVKPSETISIICTPTKSSNFGYLSISDGGRVWDLATGRSKGEKRETFQLRPFIMSAKKSDVTKFRQGSLNDSQFRNTVEYIELGEEGKGYISERMFKDIKIVKSVIEMSFNDIFSSSTLSSSQIQGTYIKDYGVLFTVNGGSTFSVPTPLVEFSDGRPVVVFNQLGPTKVNKGTGVITLELLEKELFKEDKALELTEKDLSQNSFKASNEVFLAKVLDAFTDAIGNYGHTMRGIKPNEKISVLYSSRGTRLRRVGNKSIMISAKHSDIQDYSTGKITYEGFKKRVTATTF